MILEKRIADREVQPDDNSKNLAICSNTIVFVPYFAFDSTQEVLVGFRCLLRDCPPLQRLLFEVACDGEFEERRVLLEAPSAHKKMCFLRTVMIPISAAE